MKLTKQQQIEFRKNMANRMRKFTGVTDKYDPNANMKKFMGQKSKKKKVENIEENEPENL